MAARLRSFDEHPDEGLSEDQSTALFGSTTFLFLCFCIFLALLGRYELQHIHLASAYMTMIIMLREARIGRQPEH